MDKQELPINNPAERLYVILTRMKENNRTTMTVKAIFCNTIEMGTNDENFIQGIAESFTLLKNMKEQVEKYFPSRKHRACLVMIEDIRKFISCVLENNKETWGTLMSRGNFPNLDLLNSYGYDFEEVSFNQDSLNNLIDEIKSWMKEIEESQFDEDVKTFFIHKLMEIKYLLEKYCCHGSSGIKKEIYATMVEIGIYQGTLTEDKKEESMSFFNTFLEKLFKWAGLLDPLISVGINGSPIISQGINVVKNLLPPGS